MSGIEAILGKLVPGKKSDRGSQRKFEWKDGSSKIPINLKSLNWENQPTHKQYGAAWLYRKKGQVIGQ